MTEGLKYSLFGLVLLVVLVSTGCETISKEPQFPLEPMIELEEISNDTIVQFEEGIRIKIKYEDGDGDLGNSDPDINSIFIKDDRLENADEYYLAPLAPVNSEISITGSLDIQLSTTFLLSNADSETTKYTLFVVDRSGNQSNTIETGPIIILKE